MISTSSTIEATTVQSTTVQKPRMISMSGHAAIPEQQHSVGEEDVWKRSLDDIQEEDSSKPQAAMSLAIGIAVVLCLLGMLCYVRGHRASPGEQTDSSAKEA